LLGALFVRWNIKISAARAPGTAFRKKVPIIVEVVVIALFTAVTSFPSLYTQNLSSVTINALFHTCEDSNYPRPFSADMMNLCEGEEPAIGSSLVMSLLLAALVRFLQMTVTFGTGVPCGLFVPSLYTGACLGRCVGIFVKWFYLYLGVPMAPVHPGVYAMVGAAAVLGGVCRVTISLVVIMYELTSALQLVVPFMIAVLTAKFVGDSFGQGIYDRVIELRGYPYLHDPDEHGCDTRARSLMDDDIDCVYADAGTLGDLLKKVTETKFGGFPLVQSASDPTLLGYVHTAEVRMHCEKLLTSQLVQESMRTVFQKYCNEKVDSALDFSSLVDETVLRIVPEMPVAQVHNLFLQLGIKLVLVTRFSALAGIITKKSFVHHMSKAHHGGDGGDGGDESATEETLETGRSRKAQSMAHPEPLKEPQTPAQTRQRLDSMRLFLSAFGGASPTATATSPQTKVAVQGGDGEDASATRVKKSLRKWTNYATVSAPTDSVRDFHEHTSTVIKQGTRLDKVKMAVVPWLIPALVGFLTATSGSLVEVGSEWLNNLRFGRCGTNFFVGPETCGSAWVAWADTSLFSYLSYIAVSVCFATTSALLVWGFAPMARGSGIPEVKTILGGFVMKDVLEFKTLVVKVIGLTFSVSSGMSLGKEGPLVHVACCWAHLCSKLSSRYVENESKRRELISTAVAFGTPLGGVLFSYEEVSTMFSKTTMTRAFFAAVVASLSLRWYDPTGTGKLTMFETHFVEMPALSEYPWFVLLGAVGGVLGAIFVRCNIKVGEARKDGTPFRNKVHIVIEVAVIALLTAATSWPSAFTRCMSTTTIRALFQTCGGSHQEGIDMSGLCDDLTGEPLLALDAALALAVAAMLRYVQMTFTFGTGVPCGLFVPSLYTGACMGRILGMFVAGLNSQYHFTAGAINPGVYAMVGAAAVLGGVCRVTISLVVIMFGLTNALQLIVPFMLAVLTSKFVGDCFSDGIYDAVIILRGYPYLHEPGEQCFRERARDIMDECLECLNAEPTTLGDLKQTLDAMHFGGLPLIASPTDLTLLGYVHADPLRKHVLKTLESALMSPSTPVVFKRYTARRVQGALDFSKFVDETVLRIAPETPLAQVHNIFWRLGVKLVLVARFGKIAGLITKKSFVDHQQQSHHGGHTEAVKDQVRNPNGGPRGLKAPLLQA